MESSDYDVSLLLSLIDGQVFMDIERRVSSHELRDKNNVLQFTRRDSADPPVCILRSLTLSELANDNDVSHRISDSSRRVDNLVESNRSQLANKFLPYWSNGS